MITTPHGFWLSGTPQEILQQINELSKKYFYVREIIAEFLID